MWKVRALLIAAVASTALSSAPTCPGTPLSGKCLYGKTLKRITATDAAACCSACASLAGCQGWQFGADCKFCKPAKPCVLKDATAKPYNDNCTSGYSGPTPPPAPTPPSPAGGFAFSTIFTGGAVLQHGAPVEVWGAGAAPGSAVALSLGKTHAADAVADASGHWSATLSAQPVGWNVTLAATFVSSPPHTAGASNTTSVIVSFGLVVLCSGQR